MKRTLPTFAAVFCATLVGGNLFVLFSQPSQDRRQSNPVLDGTPQIKRSLQTAEQLTHVLNLPTPAGWSVFSMRPSPEISQVQLTAIDCLDGNQEVIASFLFDSKNGNLVSVSMARPDEVEVAEQRDGLTVAECRAATAAYMARVGEMLGGVWRWESDLPNDGSVYHSRWRSGFQSATAAVDRQTGRLVYLRPRPNDGSDGRIALSKTGSRAKAEGAALAPPLSPSDPDGVEKVLTHVSLDSSSPAEE